MDFNWAALMPLLCNKLFTHKMSLGSPKQNKKLTGQVLQPKHSKTTVIHTSLSNIFSLGSLIHRHYSPPYGCKKCLNHFSFTACDTLGNWNTIHYYTLGQDIYWNLPLKACICHFRTKSVSSCFQADWKKINSVSEGRQKSNDDNGTQALPRHYAT